MAIMDIDGSVKVLGDNGYEKQLSIIDCGQTGSLFIGTIHVPKVYVGKRAVLILNFIEDMEDG